MFFVGFFFLFWVVWDFHSVDFCKVQNTFRLALISFPSQTFQACFEKSRTALPAHRDKSYHCYRIKNLPLMKYFLFLCFFFQVALSEA